MAGTVWHGGDIIQTPSNSAPKGDGHYVERFEDGSYKCDCKAFQGDRLAACPHITLVLAILARWSEHERDLWPSRYAIPTDNLDLGGIPERVLVSYDGAVRSRPPRILDTHGRPYIASYQAARRRWSYRIPELLADLVRATLEFYPELVPYERGRRGRNQALRTAHIVMRLYLGTLSSQQALSLMTSPEIANVLGAPVKENQVCEDFRNPLILPILYAWIDIIAQSIRIISTVALVDSTCFSSAIYENWLSSAKGERPLRVWNHWFKGHVLTDAATRIVCSVVPTAGPTRLDKRGAGQIADTRQFDRLLVEAKSRLPRLRAVVADKAYSDWDVLEACRKLNIRMVVPPKVGQTKLRQELDIENMCDSHPDVFHEIYRLRSSVESVFWATKSFGQYLSTRERENDRFLSEGISFVQATEIVGRFVAYNLRRIVQLECLLGQDISFYPTIVFSSIDPAQITEGRSLLDGRFVA